jgi:hypothetical protein
MACDVISTVCQNAWLDDAMKHWARGVHQWPVMSSVWQNAWLDGVVIHRGRGVHQFGFTIFLGLKPDMHAIQKHTSRAPT